MLSVTNLTKTYGHQNAIENLSFEAKEGEILGFLGPNGAGKSTTMKIATCYLSATSGKVTVCGKDVEKSPKAVRQQIGYLPEHNPLYLGMFVREYLAFMGMFYGLGSKYLKKRIEEVIDLVRLESESHKYLRQLSKGYRQRVGLAQALLHDPKVLILDEPTTGLDPNQIVEIRQVIKSISKEKTIVFSTHIMQEVQALCDRVVIINKGKKVLDEPIGALDNLKKEFVLHIETEKPVEQYEWEAIVHVKKADVDANYPNRVKLLTEEDIRKAVFLKAIESNWVILTLQQEKQSLETLFQQLTGNQ